MVPEILDTWRWKCVFAITWLGIMGHRNDVRRAWLVPSRSMKETWITWMLPRLLLNFQKDSVHHPGIFTSSSGLLLDA